MESVSEHAAFCTRINKINVLQFFKAGSCNSHKHFQDHWTHFVSGGPFYVKVFFEGDQGKVGELKSTHGPFGPGDKFFTAKDLLHEVISEGVGVAHCVFENDGSPDCARERLDG